VQISESYHRPILGYLVALIVLFALGCSSQPRFVHAAGGPPQQMFDNKTAQDCWAGPAPLSAASNDLSIALKKDSEARKKFGLPLPPSHLA
jgi:hypothetical protein